MKTPVAEGVSRREFEAKCETGENPPSGFHNLRNQALFKNIVAFGFETILADGFIAYPSSRSGRATLCRISEVHIVRQIQSCKWP
jgi:hypothetical protein